MLPAFWVSVLTTAGINGVIATGLYISNAAGALSAAHAAIAGMGGYAGAILTTNFGLPLALALAAGVGIGLVTGAFLAAVTLRMNELVAGLTTLAFGEVMVVVALNINYIGGANSFYGIPPDTTFTIVYVILVGAVFCAWRFDRSRVGLSALACREDRVAAAAAGINVPRVKITAFALGAGLAGLGGVLQAHYLLAVTPTDLGFYNSLSFIVFWVFGGSYVYWGGAFGAIALTALPEAFRFTITWRLVLYGLALTTMVVLRPQGVGVRIPIGQPLRDLKLWTSWRRTTEWCKRNVERIVARSARPSESLKSRKAED
jgi:branched-chain amino acid transport system permease protein